MGIEKVNQKNLIDLENLISLPLIVFNREKVFYMSKKCQDILGKNQGGIHNFVYDEIMKDEKLKRDIEKTILAKKKFSNYMLNISFGDEEVYLEIDGSVISYEGEDCILANIVDITEKKEAEEKLNDEKKLRELMLEVSQSILEIENIGDFFKLILDNATKSIKNSSLGSILLVEGDKLSMYAQIGYGQDISTFSIPIEDSFLYIYTEGKMDRTIKIDDLKGCLTYVPLEIKGHDNQCIKSTIIAPIYIQKKLFGMIGIDSLEEKAFDQADVKSMEFIKNNIEIALSNYIIFKEKTFLAKYDQLTRLYNRRHFEERLDDIMENMDNNRESFNLVIFDIDNLKYVNDSFGHLEGDKTIKKIADALKKNIRKTDILARTGGDEFLGIFFESDKNSLIEKFEAVLEELRQDRELQHRDYEVSFSYGISNFPYEANNIKDLVKIADGRMYKRKKKKKTMDMP